MHDIPNRRGQVLNSRRHGKADWENLNLIHERVQLRLWRARIKASHLSHGPAQVRQGAEVAHELDEWEEVHVEDADGVGAAYTRRRTVFGKISCALNPKPHTRSLRSL